MAQEKSLPVNLIEAKTWLRKFLTKKRQALGRQNQIHASQIINQKVIASPEFIKAKTVATYLGFGSEVLTDGIVEAGWRAGKNILIPITELGFHRPYFVLFKRGDPLKKTSFGPLELVEKKRAFDFREIDLVIVPGLGFDSRGFRLGYGGGVYDRIIQKTSGARHWGVFFREQFIKALPVDVHDKPLEKIF